METKIQYFDAFINGLIDWDKDYLDGNEQGVPDFLDYADIARIMKLLYLVCLASTQINGEDHLFKIFNNFVAYGSGPIEEDIYYQDTFVNFEYDEDGKIRKIKDNDSSANAPQIDNAINHLKKQIPNIHPRSNSYCLLDAMFHSYTWSIATLKCNKKLLHDPNILANEWDNIKSTLDGYGDYLRKENLQLLWK